MFQRSKKQADASDTEPAIKPKREAPGKRPLDKANNGDDVIPTPKEVRGKSKERKTVKRIRRLGVVTEDNDTPLLPEPRNPSRKMLSRLSVGYTSPQVLIRPQLLVSPGNSQPKRHYQPPMNSSSIEESISDKYSSELARDDEEATMTSSMYRSPVNKQKRDDALSPGLSEITSNTGTFTDGSALETTFTGTDMAESRLSWSKDEIDGRTTMTDSSHESDEDSKVLMPFKSESTEETWSEFDAGSVYKQTVAGGCIALSAVQLTLLFIQLILCGVASLDINPMIGPFPDAFSEWGGKNAYLMIDGHQVFRLFTPVLLHVGVLHFVINAFCQLEPCALLEREWGTCRWLTAYILSGIGAVAASCVVNPDEIGVSSSGAIMGLFGAKISQIIAYNSFKLHSSHYLEAARFDQMGGVFCSASVMFLLSLVTYIDLSANIGGFVSGFLAGMLLFCRGIASGCLRFVWAFIGFGGLVSGAITLGYLLWVETYPDNELGDACEYFRNLYPEGYDCECKW